MLMCLLLAVAVNARLLAQVPPLFDKEALWCLHEGKRPMQHMH
jgi:hypothetical protein